MRVLAPTQLHLSANVTRGHCGWPKYRPSCRLCGGGPGFLLGVPALSCPHRGTDPGARSTRNPPVSARGWPPVAHRPSRRAERPTSYAAGRGAHRPTLAPLQPTHHASPLQEHAPAASLHPPPGKPALAGARSQGHWEQRQHGSHHTPPVKNRGHGGSSAREQVLTTRLRLHSWPAAAERPDGHGPRQSEG